ncbi:response regulator [Streptomyces sp. NPDC059389]|uniref:response regulator n=1 Tax=Streptomyces sp. NPDC059389 TaxID=3346818 RepID=UPI0036C5BDD6
MIRVLLADDEPLIRGAFAALLSLESDLEIVAEAATGPEAIEMALHHRPDVAVLDLQMPGKDGVEVVERLTEALPSCKTVIVTGHAPPGRVRRALTHGVSGFVLKAVSAHELAAIIRSVHTGSRCIDPALAADVVGDGAPIEEAAERAAHEPRQGGSINQAGAPTRRSSGQW